MNTTTGIAMIDHQTQYQAEAFCAVIEQLEHAVGDWLTHWELFLANDPSGQELSTHRERVQRLVRKLSQLERELPASVGNC